MTDDSTSVLLQRIHQLQLELRRRGRRINYLERSRDLWRTRALRKR